MKKMKYANILPVFGLIVFLCIAGCSNKSSNINEPAQLDFNAPEFAVLDISDANNAIEDATISSEMTIDGSLYNYTFLNAGEDFMPGARMMRGKFWMEHFDFSKHIGRILRQLKLSDEQKTSIHGFVKTYHEAMKPLVKQFFDVNKDLIQEANLQRKTILDDVKAGKITRAEAETKIKELNQATRDKIAANPDSQKIKADMCSLREDLFKNIASLLTTDQLAKWNEAVAKFNNPCA